MKTRTTLSFFAALTLYSALLLTGYWLWQSAPKPPVKENIKVVPVNLAMFEESIIEPITEPKINPNPVEPIKPVEIKKPEPIKKIKKELKKELKPIIKPKPVQKPIPKPKPIKPPKPIKKTKPVTTPKTKVETTQKKIEKHLENKTETAKKVEPIKLTKPELPKKPTYSAQQIANAEKNYLLELREKIVNYAKDTYPRRAKRRNWEGDVTIEFVLTQNGSITKLKILKSSGKSLLDRAALEIFQDKMQNRFKAFPKEINRKTWLIKVPVGYHFR